MKDIGGKEIKSGDVLRVVGNRGTIFGAKYRGLTSLGMNERVVASTLDDGDNTVYVCRESDSHDPLATFRWVASRDLEVVDTEAEVAEAVQSILSCAQRRDQVARPEDPVLLNAERIIYDHLVHMEATDAKDITAHDLADALREAGLLTTKGYQPANEQGK